MSAINIILDEKDPQNPIFVEIELDDGKSINIGERYRWPNGVTTLRITEEDLSSIGRITVTKDEDY